MRDSLEGWAGPKRVSCVLWVSLYDCVVVWVWSDEKRRKSPKSTIQIRPSRYDKKPRPLYIGQLLLLLILPLINTFI